MLTGAGLSAESGISTFRDKDGIWAKYDYREVATPEGFMRDPAKVLEFYNMRRRQSAGVQPNAAHVALARLEAEHPGDVLIVTQNVDRLHEAAGSRKLIHMHGEMAQSSVPALRPAARLGLGGAERRECLPGLRECGRAAPRCRLVRRDALSHGAHL